MYPREDAWYIRHTNGVHVLIYGSISSSDRSLNLGGLSPLKYIFGGAKAPLAPPLPPPLYTPVGPIHITVNDHPLFTHTGFVKVLPYTYTHTHTHTHTQTHTICIMLMYRTFACSNLLWSSQNTAKLQYVNRPPQHQPCNSSEHII